MASHPLPGQLAPGTRTHLIIQVLWDVCALAFHRSQPPCLRVYPFKSSGLVFTPVPLGCPGPTGGTKEAPWVLQQGPRVVTGAGSASLPPACPTALPATVLAAINYGGSSGNSSHHGSGCLMARGSAAEPGLSHAYEGLGSSLGCCPLFVGERGTWRPL